MRAHDMCYLSVSQHFYITTFFALVGNRPLSIIHIQQQHSLSIRNIVPSLGTILCCHVTWPCQGLTDSRSRSVYLSAILLLYSVDIQAKHGIVPYTEGNVVLFIPGELHSPLPIPAVAVCYLFLTSSVHSHISIGIITYILMATFFAIQDSEKSQFCSHFQEQLHLFIPPVGRT